MTVLPMNPRAMPRNWLAAKRAPPRRRWPGETPDRAGSARMLTAAVASSGGIPMARELAAGDPLDDPSLFRRQLGPPALVETDLGGPGETHPIADDVVVPRPEIAGRGGGGDIQEVEDPRERAAGVAAEVLVAYGEPALRGKRPAQVFAAPQGRHPGAGSVLDRPAQIAQNGAGDGAAVAHQMDHLEVEPRIATEQEGAA